MVTVKKIGVWGGIAARQISVVKRIWDLCKKALPNNKALL